MKKPFSYVHCFFILLFIAIIFFSLASDLPRRQNGGFFSDEAAYFSITQSLAYDGDIRYERADIVRIRERFWAGPTGFFLKKAKNGNLYYAKSFVYPLFAAPFFRIFEVRGLLLFNGLMLFFSILMTYMILKRYHPPAKSFSFSLIFLFATVAWVYVWWLQSDFFNFFMVLAGLFFFFYPFRKKAFFYLCALFFAAAIYSKPNNVITVGIIFLILLLRREWKKFLAGGLLLALLLSTLAWFNYSQTGEWLFMGGERKSFVSRFPLEKPGYTFDDAATSTKMTADTYWQRFSLTPAVGTMNLFYYFFGRFTGMFLYFPSAFFLIIVFFFQKKLPEDWFILAAIAAGIISSVCLFPDNYFGGSGSLGNRYFLSLFPLFFFLGHKNRIFSFSLAPLLIAAVFLAPVYGDSLYCSYTPRFIGTHFPANLFPVEKTQFYTLPSNENPRAFYRSIGEKYWLFFLNDNFFDLEGDGFWSYSNKNAEFLLLSKTWQRVREFRVELTNNPLPNKVYLQIEGRRKRLALKPKEKLVVTFKEIPVFQISRRYVYHFQVQSSSAYSPYFDETVANDNRLLLGVKVRIEAIY